MLYYIYYSYMGYLFLRYSERAYYMFHYGNALKNWLYKEKKVEMNDEDWVLCDEDADFVLV